MGDRTPLGVPGASKKVAATGPVNLDTESITLLCALYVGLRIRTSRSAGLVACAPNT